MDRLVVGIHDAKLSEKLQMDDGLTLSKAIDKIMQSELVKSQQDVIRPKDKEENPEIVGRVSHFNRNTPKNNRAQVDDEQNSRPCPKCGHAFYFVANKCPAASVKSRICSRPGHFAKCCFQRKDRASDQSNQVHRIRANQTGSGESPDPYFLGNVKVSKSNPWTKDVSVNGNLVNFVLDSGADIVCLREIDYRPSMGTLQKNTVAVEGPDGTKMTVLGKIEAKLQCNEKSCVTDIFVIRNLNRSLLSRACLEALEVALQVAAVTEDNAWVRKYPEVFHGLGKMPGEYRI